MAKVNDCNVVCSACDGPIVIGDDVVMTFQVSSLQTFGNTVVPGVGAKDCLVKIEDYLSMVNFQHAQCSVKGLVVTADVKQMVLDLDSVKQNEVYRFMHDALGCRI